MDSSTSPSLPEPSGQPPATFTDLVFPGLGRDVMALDAQSHPDGEDGMDEADVPLPDENAAIGVLSSLALARSLSPPGDPGAFEPALPALQTLPFNGNLDLEVGIAAGPDDFIRLQFVDGVRMLASRFGGIMSALEDIGHMHDPAAALLNPSLDEEAYKNVLSDEGEKELRYGVVAEGESVVCCFAQTTLDPGTKTITLPCHHVFEAEPIEKWLREEKAHCPMCRHVLPSKEVRNERAPLPPPLPPPQLPPPPLFAGPESQQTPRHLHLPPPLLQPFSPPPPELNLQLASMLAHAHHRAVAEEEMMLQAALLEMYSYPPDLD